jgi:hypothetical protein
MAAPESEAATFDAPGGLRPAVCTIPNLLIRIYQNLLHPVYGDFYVYSMTNMRGKESIRSVVSR